MKMPRRVIKEINEELEEDKNEPTTLRRSSRRTNNPYRRVGEAYDYQKRE